MDCDYSLRIGVCADPRYWLVVIDHAPEPTPDRLRLQSGTSFWLEWRGQERVWQRRPRFDNDVQALGGFSTIPEEEEPRPPTPPQRHDPTVAQRSRPSQPAGFNPQRFVNTRPLRGRLIPPEQGDPLASSSTASSSSSTRPNDLPHNTPAQPSREPRQPPGLAQRRHQQGPEQPKPPKAKAKPPQPPRQAGSDSETSWPSEDPPPAEGDHSGLLQTWLDGQADDFMALMQRQQPPPTTRTDDDPTREPQPSSCPPPTSPTPTTATTLQPLDSNAPWFSVAANFEEEFTVVGLLRVLQKILHEILQQSFTQPNEYLTNLAYHACY